MDYIETAIKYIDNQDNIKQILFNRNYAEIIEGYNINSHIKGNDLCIHDYKEGTFPYVNCHYWPHYSFRPSLIDVDTILKLGNFDSSNQFFEMDYARKWTNAGYKSGFFNRITNRHIGRLTSERSNKDVKNAYDLNYEGQFEELKDKKYIKIVNLEKRKDRKETMIKNLTDAKIYNNYEFIKAIDGRTLEVSVELKKLFIGNDFGNRKGIIGCALSHYNLWKQLLNDDNNEYYVIIEDDIDLCPNFNNNFEKLKVDFNEKELIFFGYSMFQSNRNRYFDIYNLDSDNINVVPLDYNLYIGGTFGYSINKKGAQILIDYIERHGIKHGIDYLIKIVEDLHCYESRPQIVFTEWNESDKAIDTDIQRNYDSFDFNLIENDNFVFIKGLDYPGNDLPGFYSRASYDYLSNAAGKDYNCVGFNTLGFLKNKIDLNNLVKTGYIKENDGLYIKKEYYDDYIKSNKVNSICKFKHNLIRVKMLCNWCSSEQLCKEWSNMCEKYYIWKNIEITWSNENIDYYVIINKPLTNEYYDPKKTIIFQMEPWVLDPTKIWGIKTWGQWANPDPNNFLEVRGRKTHHHNNAFWQLELTYTQLLSLEIQKTQLISSICSSKYFDEGHIARVDLLKYIESKNDIVIDIYNYDNNHNFKNYKGPVKPYDDKSKGMLSYKYYFMIENNYEENFITEKLWEPILCESLVFYYGCPNVSDYINPLAYVLLDINDFEKSYQIIKKAINEDLWSQRIDIIRQEKKKNS
jgi:GR25 family glycosyltransferase involved in LPS biosynthesis